MFDSDVPITKPSRGRKLLIPINDRMNVGDSFLFGTYSEYNMSTIFARIIRWANRRNLKWKFTARKQDDGLIRWWRVR